MHWTLTDKYIQLTTQTLLNLAGDEIGAAKLKTQHTKPTHATYIPGSMK
ncbi:hypothetical protein EST38_g13614 [Candolleomyces aberdarensis]|uniref:Uncharacterized protein n=1 Tax=Candolleomyces aberdarensis TaxID=2316362 RepID=A0A4Q2CZD2_9AGAR|nr:hypothetical protein EST38_g13614 [Candolleomyces aberdarensis]